MTVKSEQDLEILDLESIMANKNGGRVLIRILEHSGYFRDTFNPDPFQHAVEAGERRLGVWLYNEMCSVDPERLNLMITERNKNA